jgi:hypothetical protein
VLHWENNYRFGRETASVNFRLALVVWTGKYLVPTRANAVAAPLNQSTLIDVANWVIENEFIQV